MAAPWSKGGVLPSIPPRPAPHLAKGWGKGESYGPEPTPAPSLVSPYGKGVVKPRPQYGGYGGYDSWDGWGQDSWGQDSWGQDGWGQDSWGGGYNDWGSSYGYGGYSSYGSSITSTSLPSASYTKGTGKPNTVTLLGGGSLPAGIEKDIEEQARQLCIQHSFSTPDEVRYVSPSIVHIEFPYQDACREFLRVSNGQLKVRQWVYRLQHSGEEEGLEPTFSESVVGETPSDCLMVRLIGDLDEGQIKKAFQAHVPLVKGVRMMVDRSTRKSKGFCFVSFHSVSDAMQAKNRLTAAGCMIQSRKVALTYAKPQSQEQALEFDLTVKAEQEEITNSAKQALSGLNGEMWSSYMQFCQQEEEKETREKQALMEALEAKKRALAFAADDGM